MLVHELLFSYGKPKVIGVIGGGGKTTFLFRLGRESKNKGEPILLTTTTKMYYPPREEVDKCIITPSFSVARKRLVTLPGNLKRIFLATKRLEGGKVQGIPLSWMKTLKLIFPGLIVVEADGSNGRPLKGYAAYEPNLAVESDLVIVMAGIDGLGEKLLEENVHRSALAAERLGIPMGSPLTAEILARLLEWGGIKAHSQAPQGSLLPFLNKVDGGAEKEHVLPIVSMLLRGGYFKKVAVGSLLSSDPVLEVWQLTTNFVK